MNTAINAIITHESSFQNADLNHVFKFHCGPQLLISGEILFRSDNWVLISCPEHNAYFSISYKSSTNEITTEKSKYLFDLAEFPSDFKNKGFLNISPKQQVAENFDENKLTRFSLMEDRLANHLSWIDNTDYQGEERDAEIYLDGEILAVHQSPTEEMGAEHNYQYSAVFIKLNPNEDYEDQFALMCITYGVPSKYINDVDNFYMPEPHIEYYVFKSQNEVNEKLKTLSEKHHFDAHEFATLI